MSLEYLSKNRVSKSALLFRSKGAIAALIGLFVLAVCSFLLLGCATLPKLHVEAIPEPFWTNPLSQLEIEENA